MDRTPISDRLERSSVYDPETGCKVWCGATTHDGYGKVSWGGVVKLAHRVAWQLVNGDIPEQMCLDHKCRTRNCCRVEHLRLVTRRINSLENSLSNSAANARKTECGTCGGPYHRTPNGERRCRRCVRAATARRQSKVRGVRR